MTTDRSPGHLPSPFGDFRQLKTSKIAERIHRKILRSKKLTRLLLKPSQPLNLVSHGDLRGSDGYGPTLLAPAAPIDPPKDLKHFGNSRINFDRPVDPEHFPAVRVIQIPRATVFGLSNLVKVGTQQLTHHDLFDVATHETSEELHRRLAIDPVTRTARILGLPMNAGLLPNAAVFTDAVAGNYAHWLTEVLPRIVLFAKDVRFSNIPLIVDDGLHRNLYESIHLATGSSRQVMLLKKDMSVQVKSLNLVTPAGYVPFGYRGERASGHSHGIFSPAALRAVRAAFSHLMPDADAEPSLRLYVRRNSGLRKLANDQEISEMLSGQGFQIISPESLSFSDQVRLFSRAQVVVGATGAAMANLLFCPPQARVHVFMAQHVDMPYWYWQRIADCTGVDLSYSFGEIIASHDRGFHGDFKVDAGLVRTAIDELVGSAIRPLGH